MLHSFRQRWSIFISICPILSKWKHPTGGHQLYHWHWFVPSMNGKSGRLSLFVDNCLKDNCSHFLSNRSLRHLVLLACCTKAIQRMSICRERYNRSCVTVLSLWKRWTFRQLKKGQWTFLHAWNTHSQSRLKVRRGRQWNSHLIGSNRMITKDKWLHVELEYSSSLSNSWMLSLFISLERSLLLCLLDEIFRDVTMHINFNSFINEITMCADESICARSIILSTLSYQTLVICTSFIVQQLIKTSSTRLDQLDFMRCLTISTSFFFFFSSAGKEYDRRAHSLIDCPRSDQPVCICPSIRALNNVKKMHMCVCVCLSLTTTIREEKRIVSSLSFSFTYHDCYLFTG